MKMAKKNLYGPESQKCVNTRAFTLLSLVCSLLITTSASPAIAATYYVADPKGADGIAGTADDVDSSDSYPGTSSAPWKTLAKAKSVATYGDVVLIRSGNYGDFADSRTTSGTDWLIYKADTGHTPVLRHVEIGGGGNDAYIELDGIHVTNQLVLEGKHVNIKNCDIQMGGWYGNYAIEGQKLKSEYLTVENCTVHFAPNGIYCGSDYSTIKNNKIYYISSDGIKAGTNNLLVEGNEIWNLDPRHDPESDDNPGGTKDIHSDGIQYYTTTSQQNITIKGNAFHSSKNNGGGAIFVSAQAPCTNVRVENNLVYDILGHQMVISNVGGTTYFNNNTIIESIDGGVLNINYPPDEMYNNLFSKFEIFHDGQPISHGNNIYGEAPVGFTPNASSVILSQAAFEALFTDYDGKDFTLAAGSSAIGFGNPDFGPNTDILGNPRDTYPDAGAYEAGNPEAPVFDPIGNKEVNENNDLIFTVSATDPEGDPIIYSAQDLPPGASFDQGLRRFSWYSVPYSGSDFLPQKYYPTFIATDSEGNEGSQTITITVNPADTDSDGLPDGWEMQYFENLNHSAQEDYDGDGITNLQEFIQGTDPTIFNKITLTSNPSSWTNHFIIPQNGEFTLEYDAKPLANNIDGVTGLSQGPASRYDDLGIITRFKTDGLIDARNGDVYASANSISYVTGTTYHFRLKIDISEHRYDVYVTPQGSNETVIATNYAFRTEQASQSVLDNLGLAPGGPHEVTNVRVSSGGSVNQPPVLDPIGDKSIGENELREFTINATDPDGDPITYSVQNKPANAAFAGQTFSWTPTHGDAGQHQVTFTASDGEFQDSETITITVGYAPVLDPIGNKSVSENTVLTFTINATDDDGNIITYSTGNLPIGANFNISTRTFDWTPDYGQAGSYSATFSITDDIYTDSETISITVNAADEDSDGLPDAWETQYFGNLAHGAQDDPDGDGLTNLQEYNNGTDPTVFDDVPNDLILDMKLDDDMADGVLDSSSYGNDGTAYGNPALTTDRNANNNQAYDFDGNGDFVSIPHASCFDVDEITVAAWIYRRDTGDDRVVCKSTSTAISDHIFSLGIAAAGTDLNKVKVRLTTSSGSTSVDGTATFGINTWTHVAFTFDRQNIRIYIDGTEAGVFAKTGDIKKSAIPVVIGNVNLTDDRYFNGKIDDVHIYNRALSVDEILELYGVGTSGNNPPTAKNDNAIVNEDSIANVIDVLANDSDDDGDSMTIIPPIPQPNHGSVVITGGGTGLTYTPTPDYYGPDSFTYTISDGQGGIDTATDSVTVTNIPDAPVLEGIGNKSVDENTTLTFSLNATDADGEIITYSVEPRPEGATFDSPFVWTPDYDDAGTYEVTFIASDGTLQDSETITIIVNNVNRPPVAVDDSAVTDEDNTVITGNVLANDTDADGDTLTIVSFTQASNGTVVYHNDDTFTYTPAANYNGSDSFTYTVSDGNGGTDIAIVSIAITNTPDAPILDAIGDKTINENQTLTIAVNATDADGEIITYSVEPRPKGATFDNPFVWTPDYDDAGTYELTFTASDGTLQDSETITIIVYNVNRPPVAVADSAVTDEDSTVTTGNVLTNDTDADGHILSVASATQATHGTAVYNNDGTFTYTPAANYNGNDSFTYTVSDGNGGTDTATVQIEVTPINDPPDVSAIPDILQKYEDEAILPKEIELATDVDSGDTLTYTYLPDLQATDYILHVDVFDGTVTVRKDVTIIVIPVLPTVISVTATKYSVEILFSEDLERSSAENTDNYSIENYSLSKPIVINTLELNAERDTVTLYTTSHTETEGVPYNLTVANVEDSAGNPMLEDTVEYTYDPGLIGLWNFNTDGGDTAQDSSGYDNMATLVNEPVWTEQGYLNFDGIDDAVEIPTNYWNVNSGTVALWAYAEDLAGTHYLFGHTTGSGGDRIQLYTLDQNLNLGLGNSEKLNIANLDLQAWHHFALTWDGTDYVVYVDGVEKSSGFYTGFNNLNEFADIGNSGDVSFDNAFAGHIDDTRIYNRALTPDEIINVYLMSDESVRENKALVFDVIATYPDGTGLTYEINQLPDGATFKDGTFAWNPWYDQAETYDLTFVPADQEQPQYSQIVTVVVEDVQLSDWYQKWLEHVGLL
jgi:hypothetical protein